MRRHFITYMIVAAAQPLLTNLFLSLAFGLGQIIIGGAMVLFTLRKRRWRQITLFGVALIGAWFACSGITELIVSGAELLARTSPSLSAARAAHIRAQADQGFLIVSLALLVIGASALLLIHFWKRRHATANTNLPADPNTPQPGSQHIEETHHPTH
jgi:hypothetical protein